MSGLSGQSIDTGLAAQAEQLILLGSLVLMWQMTAAWQTCFNNPQVTV